MGETEKKEGKRETGEKALWKAVNVDDRTAGSPENIHHASEKALPSVSRLPRASLLRTQYFFSVVLQVFF